LAALLAGRRRNLALALRTLRGVGLRRDGGLLLAVAAVFLMTALVAFLAPPQTWDSLNYHMARVAHWAQLKAVRPFATGIEVQNSRAPLAEFGMLHLYLLGSGDRWVNFVAWSAMLGSALGVAGIARQLGLGRLSARLASVYAATIPMGIIQASSTMTDAVGALWLVATATEVVGLQDDRPPGPPIVFGGAAVGLVFLTKPTAVPFLLPLLGLALWLLWRRRPARFPWAAPAAAGLVVVVLNAGHALRSTVLYGDPITGGDQLTVSTFANDMTDPRALASNLIRNAGLHLGTPSPHVNKALTLAAFALHGALGIDPNDPRTTAQGRFEIEEPTTNEIKAGNSIHFAVGLVAIGFVLWRRNGLPRTTGAYLAACLAGFVLFCWIFKWQVFGSRLHLPFFVLLAPVFGAAAAEGFSPRGAVLSGWLLVAGSLPWLLSVDSRPILPRPGKASVESVLTASRTDLLFSTGPYLRRPYREMTSEVLAAGCDRVGISLTGNGAEYPIWNLLGAPRDDLEIEWLVAGTPSARYADPGFRPCAVICDGCESAGEALRGLPLAYRFDTFRLFLGLEGAE
jgi:hypothetical protein